MTQSLTGLAAASRWARAADAGLAFRTAMDSDTPFLFAVYNSTRAHEIAMTPWTEAQKAAFLKMQANAQHTDYKRNYPDAEWLIISSGGDDIGRLYLYRRESAHHILDIAFLPEHCGKGYGSALIQDLLDEAAAADRPFTIHVEKFNPAMRLYRRLGFVSTEEQGVYDLMRWTAPPKVR